MPIPSSSPPSPITHRRFPTPSILLFLLPYIKTVEQMAVEAPKRSGPSKSQNVADLAAFFDRVGVATDARLML